ncbi:MAG: 6-phosphofructokinase [Dehalococcoidia bacterium]|nr:6-phosphofructokinase [Dehalococcoidia bacterium]
MNAALRAAVRTVTSHGATMVGYLDGFTGLVEPNFVELDDRTVGNIIQRGGTIIGTSRSKAFRDPQVRQRAAAQMRADGIEGLIVVGGDGSFRGHSPSRTNAASLLPGSPARSTTMSGGPTRQSASTPR